ncbi:MAG: insulinase family protein, partial [Pyrinomonadaceae bacterium]
MTSKVNVAAVNTQHQSEIFKIVMPQKIVPCLVLCAALLITAPCAAAQQVQAASSVPRLNFRERTLSNGLRFFAVEDHASPTVAIQVWYHVGSKDDPGGRSGFAHLFEHIMFKSTKNM